MPDCARALRMWSAVACTGQKDALRGREADEGQCGGQVGAVMRGRGRVRQ